MKVVLGVTGGIAAYKAAEIVRAFKKRGDDVRVIMSSGAQEFITPLTMQVLSENPVGTEIFDPTYESQIGHIDIARWADVVLVAPATANSIAKMAAGMADDLLTTVICATQAPIVVGPAMNTQMFLNPLVQRNMKTLTEVGYHIIDPDEGELACKEVGPGRLPDAWVILQNVDAAVRPQILAGKKVVISAGPTREHLDPARFISNPSSGRMGFALARAAQIMGADVTLVTGPSQFLTPYGVRRVDIEDAAELHREITTRAGDADIVVMAAAVADWKPAAPSTTKQTKSEMKGELELVRTKDILSQLGENYGDAGDPFIIGFAAETHDVEERGAEKRKRKKAHMLVANKIGGPDSTFGSERAKAYLITENETQALESMPKEELAIRIFEKAVQAMSEAG